MNKDVPTFHIPAGNSRFDIFKCSNGDFFVVVYKSDKYIEPGLHDRKEMFDGQQIEPVYAIRFDTIDQLHAYVDAFAYMYECTLKKTKKEDDVCVLEIFLVLSCLLGFIFYLLLLLYVLFCH